MKNRNCPKCGKPMIAMVTDVGPIEFAVIGGNEENRSIRAEMLFTPTEWYFQCESCNITEPRYKLEFMLKNDQITSHD